MIPAFVKKELNFYRIHLLFFTIVPLIVSGIFYAANGQFRIDYIDCLFLCYSALTVTGLSTVNLSTLTGFQQAVLFVLMIIGNVTVVSWVMVLVRKRYFIDHCEAVVRQAQQRHRVRRIYRGITKRAHRHNPSNQPGTGIKLDKPTMTYETDAQSPAEHIRPGEGIGAALMGGTGLGLGLALGSRQVDDAFGPSQSLTDLNVHFGESPNALRTIESRLSQGDDLAIPERYSLTSSPRSGPTALPMSPMEIPEGHFPRRSSNATVRPHMRKRAARQYTIMSKAGSQRNTAPPQRKDQNMGGFPGPLELLQRFTGKTMPSLNRRIERLFISSHTNQGATEKPQPLRWLRGETPLEGLAIGRNSDFITDELSDEQLEALGGIEYRALSALSVIVLVYFIGVQFISFIMIAPWLQSTTKYDEVFQDQPRLVPKAWFAAFQVVGAYTGGGMSLVDQGMVPFEKAYLMIFSMIFAILAGNHGLPIFLRLTIWIGTKLVKEDSDSDKALHFLLDHPRRCFLYLFPSHVTWFLAATLFFFTSLEWASFKVLNIGLSAVDDLPPGIQAVAGLFQSFAVRASGFPIVSISSLAPSFQFLCIVMMYIAVYPVALSIRSTNVYEEKSLGVFEEAPADEDEEPTLDENVSRGERIGKYLGWHLRRQVAFDIWWLVVGIWLILILERGKIMDDVNAPWFNLFRIIFEMVSAFGGIGLTLGIPTENYSFSGAFTVTSKLVVIIIMLRGRHRGLPVAIDRAVMLPSELIPTKPTQGQVDGTEMTEKSPDGKGDSMQRVDVSAV